MGVLQSRLTTTPPDELTIMVNHPDTDVDASEQEMPRPAAVITKQAYNESFYTIQGLDGDRPAWHIVLARHDKLIDLQDRLPGENLRIDELGRNIHYRDTVGTAHQASGYGSKPPEALSQWLTENYDPCTIDSSISLTYVDDDIRLCTVQRTVSGESIGLFPHYHRHECFHYITLNADDQSSLAYRAGLRSFDRVIECNGIHIEEEPADYLQQTLDCTGMQPLQMLVCSPATYLHYKQSNERLHGHLASVQDVAHPFGRILTNEDFSTARQNEDHPHGPGVTTTLSSLFSAVIINMTDEQTLTNDKELLFVTAHRDPTCGTVLADVRPEQNEAGDHGKTPPVRCSSCGTVRMLSDRYRCLECPSCDLCGMCFEQRRETLTHRPGHAMVRVSSLDELTTDTDRTATLEKFKEKYAGIIHTDTQCKHCSVTPIVGLRFKCDTCRDFDLCLACMENRMHDRLHTLLVVTDQRILEIPMTDIVLQDEVGRGGFGTVYKGKWVSKDRLVACKVISVPPDKKYLEKSFRKELAAYMELSGPYILCIFGYNIEKLPSGIQRCTLIMEYMHRGSLSRVLKQLEKLTLRRKLEMAWQIASGMQKVHAHQMIHRDIRPDNILVDYYYTAKIGDMGIARVWQPNENLTMVGCESYMPMDFYTQRYDRSLDVFTFGLTMNELFTETKHTFNRLTLRITLNNTSPVFADLIAQCLHTEPDRRPPAMLIERTLRLYKDAFERYVQEKRIPYADMSPHDKDETFIEICTEQRQHIERSLHEWDQPISPS